jgi:hypothetical protein
MPAMTTPFAFPEVRFCVDMEPLGHPGGPTSPVPVFARSASAAARIAQQVFPRGERRVRTVRDGASVLWESSEYEIDNR